MTLNEGNPCFGCVGAADGRIVRAPCCWNLDELNIPSNLEPSFINGGASVVRRVRDRWMGERTIVSFNGPCPQLDTDTGKCLIEPIKPQACRDMEVANDPKCVLTFYG